MSGTAWQGVCYGTQMEAALAFCSSVLVTSGGTGSGYVFTCSAPAATFSTTVGGEATGKFTRRRVDLSTGAIDNLSAGPVVLQSCETWSSVPLPDPAMAGEAFAVPFVLIVTFYLASLGAGTILRFIKSV